MAQSVQIATVNPWHQRLADWYIANPTATLNETAKHFGKTPSWISIVKNSDAWQDYFQQISRAHSEALATTVRERTLALGDQAISQLQEQLDQAAATGVALPPNALIDIADMALKRTGHGEARSAPQVVNNVIGMVSKEELAKHRQLMRGADREAIEGAVDVSPSPPVELKATLPTPEVD